MALRSLIRRVAAADRWHVGLVWLAANGWLAEWSGLHRIGGAFLSGAVLDTGRFGQVRLDRFRRVLLMTPMPVFFLSTGLADRLDDLGGRSGCRGGHPAGRFEPNLAIETMAP